MKLIIDIDEDVRIAITRMGLLRIPDEMQKKVDKAIQNGAPLLKGHGRLIDADVLVDGMEDNYEFCEAVNSTPTIIEADNTDKQRGR